MTNLNFAKMPQTLALTAALLTSGSAFAGTVTTYFGQDDASAIGGPNPNSTAAQLAFLTAAGGYGSVQTLTFEGVPVDTGGSMTIPTVHSDGITVSQPGPDFGYYGAPGYTGVSGGSAATGTVYTPNLYGYNTTTGGSEFYAISDNDSVNLTFGMPTNSLGFFATGLQTMFTTSFTLMFTDGTLETINLPINVNGGAEYVGFTDSTAFSSVTLSNGAGNDALGIDDISYNGLPVSSTPEPSSLVLLGTGVLGLAGAVRRRLGK